VAGSHGLPSTIFLDTLGMRKKLQQAASQLDLFKANAEKYRRVINLRFPGFPAFAWDLGE
jgi:hypothetical protein